MDFSSELENRKIFYLDIFSQTSLKMLEISFPYGRLSLINIQVENLPIVKCIIDIHNIECVFIE